MYAISIRPASRPRARLKTGLTTAAMATFLLASAAHATSINLIQNGDFAKNTGPGQLNDNTTVQNWTSNYVAGKSGYNFLFVPGKANPSGEYGAIGLYTVTAGPSGGAFIAADADYQNGAISQTIKGLRIGETYVLNFDWAAGQQTGFYGPTQQQWQVTFGSQTLDTPYYNLPGEVKNGTTVQNFSGWMPDTMIFTATKTSEKLSFLASGSPQVPPFTLLDSVSLTPAPEPETLPLLLTGMLIGAGLLKSRKRLRGAKRTV